MSKNGILFVFNKQSPSELNAYDAQNKLFLE